MLPLQAMARRSRVVRRKSAMPGPKPGVTDEDRPRALSHSLAEVPIFPARGLNRTGIPDRLKDRLETLSGVPLDAVRVQYNSAEPTRVQSHAYTHNGEIHLAPGQERHLPHEAWHAVQQMQGRVRKPTGARRGASVR